MPSKQILNSYDPKVNYGFFGYPGACCHGALQRDDPEQAEECWRRGWMDINTRMLIGNVREECARRSPKVGERLARLGPCKVEPMKPEAFIAQPEAL